MRYARIISWILFVLFFLVYLTAIKLVRGGEFVQQIDPLHTYHPFFGQTFQSREAALVKQARDLSDYALAEQFASIGHQSKQPQLSSTYSNNAGLQQNQQQHSHQLIARRQHLPQQSQTSSTAHSLHPFVGPSSSSVSPGKLK